MNYITHRRFRGKAICGRLNLKYGTEIAELGGIIFRTADEAEGIGHDPICFTTSENAHMYFARNDDGRGLERGKLTYAIAYAKRGKGYRFTEEERDMLVKDYSHWLNMDVDFILFNNDFFNADIEALKELANKLKIKI